MCGPNSAIGLEQWERDVWAVIKDALREPGTLAGLMRGFLGDGEVSFVVATVPEGLSRPLAMIVNPVVAAELELEDPGMNADRQVGSIGGDPVEVLVGDVDGVRRPLAIRVTPWITEHMFVYARRLWWPPRSRRVS